MQAPRSPYRLDDPGPQSRVITIAEAPSRVGVPLLAEVPWLRGAVQVDNDYWLESGDDVAAADPVVQAVVSQNASWVPWKRGGRMAWGAAVRVAVRKGYREGVYGVRVDLPGPISLPQGVVEALKMMPELTVTEV